MNNHDKTIINLKVSKSLKREAQELAKELGLPLTTVVTVSLKEFVRSRSLTVSAFPRLKPAVQKEMAAAIVDYKKGRNVSPVFASPKAAADHLRQL